jgi:hypothetical protein
MHHQQFAGLLGRLARPSGMLNGSDKHSNECPALMLLFSANAHARMKSFPVPLPVQAKWGDFDDHHVWHDDTWWHQHEPVLARPNIIRSGSATKMSTISGTM